MRHKAKGLLLLKKERGEGLFLPLKHHGPKAIAKNARADLILLQKLFAPIGRGRGFVAFDIKSCLVGGHGSYMMQNGTLIQKIRALTQQTCIKNDPGRYYPLLCAIAQSQNPSPRVTRVTLFLIGALTYSSPPLAGSAGASFIINSARRFRL